MILGAIKDTSTAEKLLQTTFQNIWIDIECFDSKHSCLLTWLRSVARATIIQNSSPAIIRDIDCGDVLGLAYSNGLSLNDIAKQDGITTTTVMLSLRQAVMCLREN
jgi:DNA-directed RNA polymerase specialized sigma subunit, sigma24 homolog